MLSHFYFYSQPRLFNRVRVIEQINLLIVLSISWPRIGSRQSSSPSDWLRMTLAVTLYVSVVSVGPVIPLYNWSISVCFVLLWPLPLWWDDILSYDMIPPQERSGQWWHKDKGWRIFHSANIKVGGQIISDCRGVSITKYTASVTHSWYRDTDTGWRLHQVVTMISTRPRLSLYLIFTCPGAPGAARSLWSSADSHVPGNKGM